MKRFPQEPPTARRKVGAWPCYGRGSRPIQFVLWGREACLIQQPLQDKGLRPRPSLWPLPVDDCQTQGVVLSLTCYLSRNCPWQTRWTQCRSEEGDLQRESGSPLAAPPAPKSLPPDSFKVPGTHQPQAQEAQSKQRSYTHTHAHTHTHTCTLTRVHTYTHTHMLLHAHMHVNLKDHLLRI